MLISLKTKNFRKHEDLSLTFNRGLNTLRAPNEGGKSTTLEAIAFALFGAKVLRTPFEEAVTWGKPANTLRVELVIQANGKDYTFTRSKAGAEVTHEGNVIVTGQTEVSRFAEQLLGADMGTAAKLMMASQNDIRAAFEGGPKATMLLIEQLADFDLIDRLLDKMGKDLVLGSDAGLQSRLTQTEEALKAAQAAAIAPDFAPIDVEIAGIDANLASLQQRIKDELEPEHQRAFAEYKSAESVKRMRDMIEKNLADAEAKFKEHTAQKVEFEAKAKDMPDPERIAALRRDVEDAQAAQVRIDAYQALAALAYPEVFWEGDRASLEAELDTLTGEASRGEQEITRLQGELSKLAVMKITTTSCGLCGKDVSEIPEVKAKNAEIAQQEQEIGTKIDLLKARVAEAKDGVRSLKAVLASATPFETYLRKNGQHVEVDTNFVPPKITWKGEVPNDRYDGKELRKQLSALEEQAAAAQRAKARADALSESLGEDQRAIEAFRQQLADAPPAPDYRGVEQAALTAVNALNAARDEVTRLSGQLAEKRQQRRELELAWKAAQDKVEALATEVSHIKREIEEVAFNNALVKKIKAARPVIADRLWNQVLSAVSNFFSQIRGEKSTVTKAKEGFLVDGRPIEALSGSTLDALALAIRIALVKTFLPHVGLLVLDEPAAAMDQNRTASTLGFLAACGFTQILIASHDPLSEQVADSLIQL